MIDVDERYFPLIVFTFRGTVTMEELERYLAASERLLEQPQPYVGLVLTENLRLFESALVRRQAKWMKQNRERIRRQSLGVALVIESPMIRGVLKAILWIEPMPQPYKVCATKDEAIAFLRERLRAAGIELRSYPGAS